MFFFLENINVGDVVKYDHLSAIGIIINKTGCSYTIFWITWAPNFRCDYFAELDHYEFINLC